MTDAPDTFEKIMGVARRHKLSSRLSVEHVRDMATAADAEWSARVEALETTLHNTTKNLRAETKMRKRLQEDIGQICYEAGKLARFSLRSKADALCAHGLLTGCPQCNYKGGE